MTTLKVTGKSALQSGADTLVVFIRRDGFFTAAGRKVNEWTRRGLADALKREGFQIKADETFLFYTGRSAPDKIIAAAIPGKLAESFELREAAYAATRSAMKHGSRHVAFAFDAKDGEQIAAVGEGALLATYEYKQYKSDKGNRNVNSITLCCGRESREDQRRAKVFSEASFFVRDMVNEPPNSMNALRLSALSKEAAEAHGLDLRIFGPSELKKMGAEAFLSVGKGSEVPGQMIRIVYEPRGTAHAHVALVGKGITFDSGGLSLKNEKAMEHMKSDMAGAATVLSCVRAAAQLKLPVKVTALLMAIENMPDSGANRPGDVIRAMNGKTIEITNTDAEGRLALADGLTYAQQLKPDYLVDIATLTGAQVVSLGCLIGAVMGNDPEFVDRIVQAGERSGEFFWPMPLHEPYRDFIKSSIADIRNSSGILEAPALQAGLFLSEFVDHSRWVHLDIAGPSWHENDSPVFGKGATGFGARCLLEFLRAL